VDLLVQVYGAIPVRITQTVEAVTANESTASQLRVKEGAPLLMVNRVLFSAESSKPIEFSQDFLRGDFARIHMDIDLN